MADAHSRRKKPYLQDPDVTLYCGDALEVLGELPSASVDCCVTSPPYWGLRDYEQEGQIGLEQSPADYVGRLVEVFQEIHRVLVPHGTVWLNLGDSFVGKQLMGIPWRVALALQGDWYLRSDIIWAKPNPMPESVKDRPTKAHEYLFLLSQQGQYFFDQEAVREPYETSTLDRNAYARTKHVRQSDGSSGGASYLSTKAGGEPVFIGPTKEDSWSAQSDTSALFANDSGTSERSGATPTRNGSSQKSPTGSVEPALPQTTPTLHPSLPPEAPRGPDGRRNTHVAAASGSIQHRDGERWPNEGRNVRSVWEIATQNYPEAHFATFPEELARRCIAAGCPENGIVLDPFIGSGTTALVSRKLGRKAIGIDLNQSYLELAARRLQQQSLLMETA